MPQVLSKVIPITSTIPIKCVEYVHPWTNSCAQATTGLYLYCIYASFKLYGSVYLLALLMRGRSPTKNDIKKTLSGILQSTAFLSFTGFGYSLFLCSLRKVLGHFNILTVSGVPVFLSSIFAILIERPSRRTLLSLYVSNVATETVWNMLVSRKMVKNIPHGSVAIFGASMALLLFFYKGGHGNQNDPIFKIIRFLLGPYESKDYAIKSSQSHGFYRENGNNERRRSDSWSSREKAKKKNFILHILYKMLKVYKDLIYKIKGCDKHALCPHPHSCIYYTLQGATKMFSIGLGIQVALKLALNIPRIFKSPSSFKQIFLRKDILNLATFLGAYSGLFKASMCLLRRTTGKDKPGFAVLAGLIAGLSFRRYPDTTVALYVLWKAAHISYNMGIENGMLPKVPGFTEFLYCFSTAILFHAAIIEPTNLRPSYWKFLHNISGGRIACMRREPLDIWGLNTSESLATILKKTRTVPVVLF